MRYRIYKFTLLFTLCVWLSAAPTVAMAGGLQGAFGPSSPLETVAGGAGVTDKSDIGRVSGQVINVALTLVGLIFLLLMVYGGYLWMMARGEEDQVKKAQMIIRNTMIGLVLVLSAYAITVFVTGKLGQ